MGYIHTYTHYHILASRTLALLCKASVEKKTMYKCNYCDYTTTVKPNLRRHEKYKHGEILTNNLNDLPVPAPLDSPPSPKKSMKY